MTSGPGAGPRRASHAPEGRRRGLGAPGAPGAPGAQQAPWSLGRPESLSKRSGPGTTIESCRGRFVEGGPVGSACTGSPPLCRDSGSAAHSDRALFLPAGTGDALWRPNVHPRHFGGSTPGCLTPGTLANRTVAPFQCFVKPIREKRGSRYWGRHSQHRLPGR
jgi:hypothetical protein